MILTKPALPSLDEVEAYAKLHISKKRFKHTEGVCNVGVTLARKYGIDQEKTAIACLLHDVAKSKTLEQMNDLIEGKRHGLPDLYRTSRGLTHAAASMIMAREDLKIRDKEILNAIRYHTTGNKGLSMLSKIVYMADYLDPERNLKEQSTLMKRAFRSFNSALFAIIHSSLLHVVEKERFLAVETVQFYNEIRAIVKK